MIKSIISVSQLAAREQILIPALCAKVGSFGACRLFHARPEVQDHTFDGASALGQELADISCDRLDSAIANFAHQSVAQARRNEQEASALVDDLERIRCITGSVSRLQLDQVRR